MTTIVKTVLSGSTNGRGIKVVATSSAGTTIHTAHSTSEDEIWLYAQNTDSTDRKLTIEYGGTTSPDDLIEIIGQPGVEIEVKIFAMAENGERFLSKILRFTYY